MSSSKKLTCKETLRQVFICLRPRTPTPLLYTLYMCIQDLFTQGRRERGKVKPERRGEGKQFTKLGWKYQYDWMYLQSMNSDKHLLPDLFTGQFFLDDDILLWCLYSNQSMVAQCTLHLFQEWMFMKKCTIIMYKNIGVGRLGYRAGKGGRRGILNTSQYLGSLSTDSEKTWQERVSHSSFTNIFPPGNFQDAWNFVPSSIYCRYSMWLGKARELCLGGGGVFFSWNSSLVLRSPASTSSSPLTCPTKKKHATSSIYIEQ